MEDEDIVANMMYEYVYAPDDLGDYNNKFLYGVKELVDFPEYAEFFKTIKALERNTKKYKLDVINRKDFLAKYQPRDDGHKILKAIEKSDKEAQNKN